MNAITRLGRGKGYYDRFLRKLRPDCFTIGIGFNQQYLPLNNNLLKATSVDDEPHEQQQQQQQHLPVNEAYDFRINEFLCESLIISKNLC